MLECPFDGESLMNIFGTIHDIHMNVEVTRDKRGGTAPVPVLPGTRTNTPVFFEFL